MNFNSMIQLKYVDRRNKIENIMLHLIPLIIVLYVEVEVMSI